MRLLSIAVADVRPGDTLRIRIGPELNDWVDVVLEEIGSARENGVLYFNIPKYTREFKLTEQVILVLPDARVVHHFPVYVATKCGCGWEGGEGESYHDSHQGQVLKGG